MLKELSRFKATNVIISSNVPLRQDGLPYASFSEPSDPGVVVSFRAFKKDYIFSCDCWTKVKDNLRAIGKHIEALRGIERWGVSSIEEIFEPFLLPTSSPTYHSNSEPFWWEILEVSPDATIEEIKTAYRNLSRKYHPDTGGDRFQWDRLQLAYQNALSIKT
ncbi:J domain-containing protein [Cyanothece sp. BG0011]|uniref:J domain-containing protein n=1 Tax=Cyanothece sp. BG0011 TaxID=2082950 RepID=UPI000D1DE306|nr:J domain-containing protein [Cyanothece sp. BG0011]